ncbi:hypothetical protein MF271_07300 [Deinococcus sp. KNUC1210]|uniref:hypothetical protein n=1 Tax=Deinococcus sp. KNUC1210 TaxID=2917691 RepID=UPI001EF06104|nr:hypothetical protein [Deinococcus sp. KNUC1210]ULH16386.1 hypothetical protein MF271_07300 [Deinococcus sp. KNUC1210]
MTQSEPPVKEVESPPPQWPVLLVMLVGSGIGLVVLLLVLMTIGGLHRLTASGQSGRAADVPQLEQHISGTYLGCHDKQLVEHLSPLKTTTPAPLQSEIEAALASQACTRFQAGDPVYLDSVPLLKGLVQLHRRHSTAKWWTDSEAIRIKP